MKNTIQIIGLCIYNFGIMIYSSIQVDQMHQAIIQLGSDVADLQIWEEVRPCLIAIPCVLALGTVLMSGVASKLYDEFAWTIYKHISADLKMKRRYLTFQVSGELHTLLYNSILTSALRFTLPFSSLIFSSFLGLPYSLLSMSSIPPTLSLA